MYLAEGAASMPWCGCAACNVTTTGGLRTEPRGGPSPTCFPSSRNKRIGKAARMNGGVPVARYTSAAPGDPHPIAPAFIEAAREMGMPILDDVNGPMRPGAG